jgi:hypothetical protein
MTRTGSGHRPGRRLGMPTYEGHCHCGALGFRYRTELPVERWQVRACQCSFCRRHAVLSTSDPAGRLEFRIAEADAVHRYRFALRTADFLVCRRCGVYIGAQIDTGRGSFGIINTRALAALAAPLPAASPVSYGAEDEAARMSRRAQRWTPLAAPV